MNYIILAAGLAVLAVVLIDLFKTILYVHGGGFLSGFIAKVIWKFFFALSGKNARSPLLNYAGGAVLIMLLVNWCVLLWLGYSLVYLAFPGSVVDTSTEAPASSIGTIYYVGYVLTSLGNGDFKSGSDTWRLVSNVMGINSMLFLSLGVSYLLPVLQAVVDKRNLAALIQKLGRTPQEIIREGYNGHNFTPLYDRFLSLEPLLLKHGERHLAYPILHYFHTNNRAHALHISLAVLDEAIGIQETYELDNSEKAYTWKVMRKAVDELKERQSVGFQHSNLKPPPFAYFDSLPQSLKAGRSADDCSTDMAHRYRRRARLRSYVASDGWEWSEVVSIGGERQ